MTTARVPRICRILLLGVALVCAGADCFADQKQTSQFYLVGMGPGDPDLMTLRAVKVVEEADVIFCSRNWAEKMRSSAA